MRLPLTSPPRDGRPRAGSALPRSSTRRRGRSALLLALCLIVGGTVAQTQESPVSPSHREHTLPPLPPPPPIPLRRWSPAEHDRVPFRPGRFESEIRAYENADRASPPPVGAVLFVGSSSIRVWKTLQDDFEGIPVLNRGFGGSEIEDLIHYARRIIQPYYARRIVIYAGDNDLHAGKSPEAVFNDFRTLIHVIRRRQPRVPIAFLSIKPSPARAGNTERIREANRLIREYCESHRNMEFIDIFTKMLDENGQPRRDFYLRDRLHMAPSGYALWAKELSPFVRAARGPVAMGSSR